MDLQHLSSGLDVGCYMERQRFSLQIPVGSISGNPFGTPAIDLHAFLYGRFSLSPFPKKNQRPSFN